MPLLETLIITVAPAIAKTVLKLCAGDDKLASEGGASAIEILARLIPDIRARTEAGRQLATIGEKAAESLVFIFETEGKRLMIDDQEAVAKLVAQTLDHSKITPELLVLKDLDPVQLARHFLSEIDEQLVLLPPPRAKLVTRVIEEASQSIIDIAHVLPNFGERTSAELLRRDRVLIDAAQRTLDALERIRSQANEDQEAEAAKFETEYRRAVARNLDKMELFGVDLSRASKSHQLSVAYVSLDVGSSVKTLEEEESVKSSEEDDEESVVHSVETALAENKRILVKGPAGAGKTTLLRWIAVRAASRGFEYPLEDWNDAIPFVIRLRQFGDSPFPPPETFPSLVASTIADTMPQGWVHRRLKSGNAVVMIDGVDEVAESRCDEVRKWVKELADTFPAVRLIVTSRPHAVEQGWLESEGFGEADLQPMDTASIQRFIDHWHEAVAQEVQQEEGVTTLQRLAQNLKATLMSNRAIRRLATNPLLCGVICALHRDANEQLPEDRLDLYERCCSMLLERRDPESGLAISGYPRLTYRQKRALLDDLAYWMIKNEWTEVSLDSARNRLSKKIATIKTDVKDSPPINGENVLALLIARSGMLRQPVEGKLDFAHRTFQEFMAAHAAVGEGDTGVFVSNSTNPLWREVIVLGAGLARRAERSDMIRSLLARGDKDHAHRHELHLLAAACLDTAVDLDSDVKAEVESRIQKLVPPKNLSEAMLLAEAAGEIAVPFLKRSPYVGARQAAACVRALALIGSLEAVQAIAEYADDSSFSVLREVVRSADRVETSIFLQLVAPRLDARRLPGDAVAHAFLKFGISGMKSLELAEKLSLSGRRAGELSILQCVPNLKTLDLRGPAVTDLDSLGSLTDLRDLTLSSIAVTDLSPLQRLINLNSLRISYSAVDLLQIAGLAQIQTLSLWNATISNLWALKSLVSLQSLIMLQGCIDDLAPLKSLVNLQLLYVAFRGSDLTPLRGLTNLKSFYLCHSEANDFSPLNGLTSLRSLDLYDTKVDLATLQLFPCLQKLGLRKSGEVNPDQVRSLRRKYPGARIINQGE